MLQLANRRDEVPGSDNPAVIDTFFGLGCPTLCNGFARQMHDDVVTRNAIQRRQLSFVPTVKGNTRIQLLATRTAEIVDTVATRKESAHQLPTDKAGCSRNEVVHSVSGNFPGFFAGSLQLLNFFDIGTRIRLALHAFE